MEVAEPMRNRDRRQRAQHAVRLRLLRCRQNVDHIRLKTLLESAPWGLWKRRPNYRPKRLSVHERRCMAASISGAGTPVQGCKRYPLARASSAPHRAVENWEKSDPANRLCKQFIYDRPQVSGIQVIYFSDSDLILDRHGQTSGAT
jgi:hypothetical protein